MPKDNYCSKDSPVIYGLPQTPIYGKDIKIVPRIPGKQTTPYERKTTYRSFCRRRSTTLWSCSSPGVRIVWRAC